MAGGGGSNKPQVGTSADIEQTNIPPLFNVRYSIGALAGMAQNKKGQQTRKHVHPAGNRDYLQQATRLPINISWTPQKDDKANPVRKIHQ